MKVTVCFLAIMHIQIKSFFVVVSQAIFEKISGNQ